MSANKKGRKPGGYMDFFNLIPGEFISKRKVVECKFCRQAKEGPNKDQFGEPKKMTKRQENCIPHLKSCQAIPVSMMESVQLVADEYYKKPSVASSSRATTVIDLSAEEGVAAAAGSSVGSVSTSTRLLGSRSEGPNVCSHCGRDDSGRDSKRLIVPVRTTRTMSNWVDRDFSDAKKKEFHRLLTEMIIENNINYGR